MSRLAILACLLTALLGCVNERPRCSVYHFQSSYPAAYRPAAIEAAARWSAWSGLPVGIALGPDDDSPACGLGGVHTPAEYDADSLSLEGDRTWAARHRETDGNITIAPFTWRWDECTRDLGVCATGALMHEFAHEYGMRHVEDPDSIMCVTNPSPRTDYGKGDGEEFTRVTGLRPVHSF